MLSSGNSNHGRIVRGVFCFVEHHSTAKALAGVENTSNLIQGTKSSAIASLPILGSNVGQSYAALSNDGLAT